VLFSFVSTLAKRLAGKTTTLVISFVSKGSLYKDQIEELVLLNGFIIAHSQRVTFSAFSLISIFFKLQLNFQRHYVAYFC